MRYGLLLSPVLTSCAFTPRLALLIALTTPAGVAVLTRTVVASPPPMAMFRSKASPLLMLVVLAADGADGAGGAHPRKRAV